MGVRLGRSEDSHAAGHSCYTSIGQHGGGQDDIALSHTQPPKIPHHTTTGPGDYRAAKETIGLVSHVWLILPIQYSANTR